MLYDSWYNASFLLLQSSLLEHAVERAGRHIVGRLPGNGNTPGLIWM
jgi:hypothetical protein